MQQATLVESRSWTGAIACDVTGEMSETEESAAGSRKTITGRAQSETGDEREMSCFPAERKSIGVMTECVQFGGGEGSIRKDKAIS